MGSDKPHPHPLRDADGKVTSIRPHKGGILRRDRDDDEHCGAKFTAPSSSKPASKTSTTAPPFSTPLFLRNLSSKPPLSGRPASPPSAFQALSFVRNPIFRAKLVAILERFGIQRVIVVFDNEIKDKPGMPSYKADPFDRYWHIIWAKYIAWDLMKRRPAPRRARRGADRQPPRRMATRRQRSGHRKGRLGYRPRDVCQKGRRDPRHRTSQPGI